MGEQAIHTIREKIPVSPENDFAKELMKILYEQ